VSRSAWRSATSRSTCRATAGGWRNHYRFHAIRLWEQADRIGAGDLQELAPLLVLCQDNPELETVYQERELILGLDAPRDVRADLLAVALTVACRFFPRLDRLLDARSLEDLGL
jgi:hypothetical protein